MTPFRRLCVHCDRKDKLPGRLCEICYRYKNASELAASKSTGALPFKMQARYIDPVAQKQKKGIQWT